MPFSSIHSKSPPVYSDLQRKKSSPKVNWHAHIFIAKKRYHKTFIYQMLAIKSFDLIILDTLKKTL